MSRPTVQITDRRLFRARDLVIACTLILLVFPLMVFVGVAIKLDSTGPVFSRQSRIGPNGRRFVLLRFRTIVHDPERSDRAIWDRAAQETRLGQFLRQTRIEDLPLLVNVLRGDVTLIETAGRKFAIWAVWIAAAGASGALYQAGSMLVELLAE